MTAEEDNPKHGESGLTENIKKVLAIPGGVLKDAAGTLLNTTKFLASARYRREVGYPWLKHTIVRNKNAVWQEMSESEELLRLLWRYAKGQTLDEAEQRAVREQMTDLMKVVPALGIFALPGGAVLLPMLARALPWDLLPSAFREKEGISEADVEDLAQAPPEPREPV